MYPLPLVVEQFERSVMATSFRKEAIKRQMERG
jgi:hypothetical protein